MPSSTMQRIGSTEPKLSGRCPDLFDVERIGLAGDRLAPSGNGNRVSRDNQVESRFSALSPDMVAQAIWIAEQLRASLEPNIVLEHSQEVLNLIYERYKLLCRQINLVTPPEIEQDFLKVVVDKLVGTGPLQPLFNEGQRKMEG
jgi:hypothetical protein